MYALLTQFLTAVLVVNAIGSPATPETELHCVVEVVGHSEAGEMMTTEPICFGSFAHAMQHASDGQLVLPPEAVGSSVFTDAATGAAAATFTIGIHYSGYNGSGSSITVVGSRCGGGYWNATGWWANRIRSSYNGCPKLRHYDEVNCGGISQTTYTAGQVDNLTTLAGRVESVQYLP